MKRIIGIAVFCMAVPTLAQAGETAWIEVAPDARVRLITSDVYTDGKTLVAIEADLPVNMKTYWRIPGETGIPTVIDTSTSVGVNTSQILWPIPRRENKDGYVDHVYYGYTVLPVELRLDGPNGVLNANVVMGVCTDICVPVRADFSLPLDFEKADIGHDLRIQQALSAAPKPFEGDLSPIGDTWFDTSTETLHVTVLDPDLDINTLIADTGHAADLFGMPQKSPTAGVILFKLLGRGREDGLQGQPIHFTFELGGAVYELDRQIVPAGS